MKYKSKNDIFSQEGNSFNIKSADLSIHENIEKKWGNSSEIRAS